MKLVTWFWSRLWMYDYSLKFTNAVRRKQILTTKAAVYTTLKKFELAALFLRLGLPSTLIRHENGAFRKRSSNRRNLKTPALSFRVETAGAFRKGWRQDKQYM